MINRKVRIEWQGTDKEILEGHFYTLYIITVKQTTNPNLITLNPLFSLLV